MPNSFRYLLAVTGLVALLFAAISAWPLISNWMRSSSQQQATAVPVAAVTQQAPVPGNRTSPSIVPPARRLPGASASQPGPSATSTPANARPMAAGLHIPGSWTTGDGEDSLGWCTALESLTLFNQPGGDPLFPVNLNRCPLTIAKGTRLGLISREGSWLLVHSTFSTTGWVHESKVSEVRMEEIDL